jgi:hypothetical protein
MRGLKAPQGKATPIQATTTNSHALNTCSVCNALSAMQNMTQIDTECVGTRTQQRMLGVPPDALGCVVRHGRGPFGAAACSAVAVNGSCPCRPDLTRIQIGIPIRNSQPFTALPADFPVGHSVRAPSDHPADSIPSDLRRHSRLVFSSLGFPFGFWLLQAIPCDTARVTCVTQSLTTDIKLQRNHRYCGLQPDSVRISGYYSGHSAHGILVSYFWLVLWTFGLSCFHMYLHSCI